MWRLAKHSLPTTDVPKNHNMFVEDACPLCGCEDSWRHALVSCSMSRCIWALSDEELVSQMTSNDEASAKQWIFQLYDTLSYELFTKMVATLWAVWFARHKAIFEAEFQSPFQTIAFVNSYLHDLMLIPKGGQRTPGAAAARSLEEKWLPPTANCMKINVDGAIARNKRGGAVAAVCRDGQGLYLGSSQLCSKG